MHLLMIGPVLLLAVAAAVPATAQSPSAPTAVARTVLAGTKLPDLAAAPVYFRVISVTIPASATSHLTATANGILYQLAGSAEITAAGEAKTVPTGEALFIAAGSETLLKAGSDGPSRCLHFLLVPAAGINTPVETKPAVVTGPAVLDPRILVRTNTRVIEPVAESSHQRAELRRALVQETYLR